MSLILGIYSRKKAIDHNLIQPVIDDFSQHREVKIHSEKKFVIAGYEKRIDSGNIFELLERRVVTGVGGELLDFQDESKELQKKGYEFKDAGNSAEYILYSFLSSGEKFVKYAKGAFGFCIYDSKNDELLIANDHYGIYPLFIYSDDDYFIFSNEYEPILKYPKFNFKMDEESVAEYFILGAPLGGKTFFKYIKNISPATIVKVSGSLLTESCYNITNIRVHDKSKLKDFAACFADAFKQAVDIRTENTGKLCCALSGGIDTRLVLSAMPVEKRKKLKFVSLLTEPLNEEEDRDVIIAKMITSRLGLNHVIEPMGEWTNVWVKDFDTTFFDDTRFRNKDFIISGHYGSELVKGEFISLIQKKVRKQIENNNKSFFKRIIHKSDNGSDSDDIALPDIFTDDFKKFVPLVCDNLDKEINCMSCENKELQYAIYFMTRSFFSKMYSGSYGSWLMTYKFPLEWSLPFLDKNILDLLLSMPLDIIIRKDQKFYNQIYKDHFRELIDIPTSSYFGEVEQNCIPFYGKAKEPKLEKLPKYEKAFEKILSNGDAGELNIFDIEKIRKYKGQGNHPDIRAMIEFETWLKYINKV